MLGLGERKGAGVMENKSYAFWTGMFTIGLLVAAALTVVWFTRDRIERLPYDLVAHTSVNGLSADARVRYRGLSVGKVQRIRFDPQQPGRIVIRILVDKDAPITHSTFATLSMHGVTGIGFIQLDDNGADPRPLRSDAQHVAQIELRPGLLEQLQENGQALLQQIQQLATNLNRLSNDDARTQLLASAQSVRRAADSVTALTQTAQPALAKMPATLDAMDRTLASTNRLAAGLGDPRGPLMVNLERAGTAAQQMNQTVQQLGAQLSYDTLPRLSSLADEARSASRSFDRAADVVGGNPRSLLFGVPRSAPGPGEPGFVWPPAH